ncbi:unnamed protein product [Phytophthora lilii]|uniref:Unnamed protein product n=1 Tax=Phytophthora lilii TaxID=2077276 RepID=A0A9W6WLV4_9STRA|nr:unnamed protein product [Phytophthora lilii]
MTAAQPIYRVGQRVDGLYDENTDEMWYPGRCVHLNEAETDSAESPTFEVLYDDGEVETHVRPEFLRQHVSGTICVGTRVLCRYDGGEEFYPGQVSDVQENGRYTIAYDDGEVEEDVPLDHIMEPKDEEDEGATEVEGDENAPSESDAEQTPREQPQQQEENKEEGSETEMEETSNPANDAESNVDVPHENEERANDDGKLDEPPFKPPKAEQLNYDDAPQPTSQNEDRPDLMPLGVAAERVYIVESLQLLEKRLGDAASTKSVLSTLVKQMRAYPQITADLVHERSGERLIIDALKFHQSHAVIQCYDFVLLRRLCFLCVKSTHYLLRNGIVELVIQAMNGFAEDAILQASACGALAVFTRVQAGLNILIEYQVAQLVLSTLIYHKTLAASGRRAAALILSLNGLAELSTVMARYPTEPSIQKYSAAASKQIALCSVRQSPTKRIKDTATEILREAESLENTPTDRQPAKRSSLRGRSTNIGKRKSNPTTGFGGPEYPRGAAYNSYRIAQGLSKSSSPYGQVAPGFDSDATSFGYPAREFHGSSTAPQQPSSLVILDGNLGMDSGFGSTNKRKLNSKEDRQSELFDAYGIQGVPDSIGGRPNGTKRAQLRAHIASAESAWATPQQRGLSASKPYSSRSEHRDHGPAHSHRDFMSSRQNRWGYGNDEPQNPAYDYEFRQPRGAKRKKKTPAPRTAFQVKIEGENQLRVSRETRSPYPSPQRLGAATKRAAKARHKRIAAGAYSSLSGRSNNASSESLNDYATQLFQDNVSRGGTGIPTSSKLTPREKEEIRERERLSFAEKLHKMIDKAKSTLANGNTTSIPAVDDTTRQPKSVATSKVARKSREPSTTPSDDKRPQSKKTRAAASSITPKHVAKAALSPREASETRPPKTTSGAAKRQAADPVGSQTTAQVAPAVPRVKPSTSKPVATPKATVDQQPRSAVKSGNAASVKPADKHEAEKAKEPDTHAARTEAIQANSPANDEPSPVNSIAASEPAAPIHAQTEPVETTSTQLTDPVVSSSSETIKVEVTLDENLSDVVSAAAAGVVEQHSASPQSEVPSGELLVNDLKIKEEETVPTPMEAEAVGSPAEVPSATKEDCIPESAGNTIVEPAVELTEAAADLTQPASRLEPSTVLESSDEQTSVSPLEEISTVLEPAGNQPSGGSGTIDAMYGDNFSEFDGGDDEDIVPGGDTDDAQTPITETSDPPTEIPLQESKSGEALYDDGYDEFDEDEGPNAGEYEVDDASAPAILEILENDTSGAISDQPVEIVLNSVPNMEVQSESLVDQGDILSAAAVEEPISPPAEGRNEQEDSVVPGSTDKVQNNAIVDAPVDESVVNEDPDQQSETTDVSNVLQEEPIKSASVESNIESQDASEAANLGSNLSEVLEGVHINPVEMPSDENASGDDTTVNIPDSSSGELTEDTTEQAAELDERAEIASVSEPAGDEHGATDAGLNSQSVAPTGEATTTNDPSFEDKLFEKDLEAPSEVIVHSDDFLVTNESETSLEEVGEEVKKLCEDISNVSLQSAAYDEDNFDDEETHQEVEPNDGAEINPVTSPADEPQEVVDYQEVEAGKKIESIDATDDAEATSDVVTSGEESKVLVANSSEVRVQSGGYEHEGFDEGTQEEPVYEKEANPEDQAPEQQYSPGISERADDAAASSMTEDTDPSNDTPTTPKSAEVALDTEALSASETYGGEDFDDGTQEDALNKARIEISPSDPTDEKQLEFSPLKEPEAVAEAEGVPTALDKEYNDEQQLVDGADTHDDNVHAEHTEKNADASDNAAATVTEDPIEPSNLLPDASTPSAAIDVPEIEIPTGSDIAQDETLQKASIITQPATYDDDAFDDGAEEEVESGVDVGEQINIVVSVQDNELSPEQIHKDEGHLVAVEANDTIDPVPIDEKPLDSGLQVADEAEQFAINVEPTIVTEETDSRVNDNCVSGQTQTLGPATSLSEGDDDHTAVPCTSDDPTTESPTGHEEAQEVTLPETESQFASQEEESEGQDSSSSPKDDQNVDFIHKSTEAQNEPGSRSVDLIEPNIAERTNASTDEIDETDQNEGFTPEDGQTLENNEEVHNDVPEAEPTPTNTTDVADASVEPSEDVTFEETEYRDAGFDDFESSLTDVTSENEPIQSQSGEGGEAGEATSAESVSTNGSPSALATQSEGNDSLVSNDKVLSENDVTTEADEAPEKESTPELSEAIESTYEETEVEQVKQSTTDSGAEADASGNTNYEVDNASKEATPVEPSLDSIYDEDFPSDPSPELREDVTSDTAPQTDNDAVNSDNIASATDSPASDPSEESEAYTPEDTSVNPSAALSTDIISDTPAKEEGYDEGFDDDNASRVESSDLGNEVGTTGAPGTESVIATEAGVPKFRTVVEVPIDSDADESKKPEEGQSLNEDFDSHAVKGSAQAAIGENGKDSVVAKVDEMESRSIPVEPELVETGAAECETKVSDRPSEEGGIEVPAIEPKSVAEESLDVAAVPEVVESKAIESDIASENVGPETLQSDTMQPDLAESDRTEAVEAQTLVSDTAGSELDVNDTKDAEVEVDAPIAVTPADAESKVIESETVADVSEEHRLVEHGAGENEAVESEIAESEAVLPGSVEPEAVESEVVESEGIEHDGVDPPQPTTEAVDSASVLESAAEDNADAAIEALTAPKESPEEPLLQSARVSEATDPVDSDDNNLACTEVVTEGQVAVKTSDLSSMEEGDGAKETKEDSPQVGEPTSQSEEFGDNDVSVSIDAPVVDNSPGAIAPESEEITHAKSENLQEVNLPSFETASPTEENAIEPVLTNDAVPNGDQESIGEVQNTSVVIDVETSSVTEEPMDSVSDAIAPEPTEPTTSSTEEILPLEKDKDSETDASTVESSPDESQPLLKNTTTAEPGNQEDKPSNQGLEVEAVLAETEVQETVAAPEASEELAIEVDPPESVEATDESPQDTPGPRTEDQYDDEDGYNEFDDQGNDSTAPAAVLTIDTPAPVAATTEAPATEDEYEDYENEDYGEEEKAVDPPADNPVAPSSTRSEPTASAREEEIEEVADEPEGAEEEAYADDQDEYNNEYEDDTAAPSPKASSPAKDKPSPRVEASADEYEDDEEYADDEIEDSSPAPAAKPASPPKPAAPAANKSDDEMEEELGYDSEYAESDG